MGEYFSGNIQKLISFGTVSEDIIAIFIQLVLKSLSHKGWQIKRCDVEFSRDIYGKKSRALNVACNQNNLKVALAVFKIDNEAF